MRLHRPVFVFHVGRQAGGNRRGVLAGLPPAPIKLDSLVTTDPKLTEARVESWEDKAPACVAGGR